ncbi:hypothetical protein [Pseudomonas oryzihabitans]|uniref:hypothetical protein n=1 Tax=Pseudomonas oryzihabitans TaxID=47885 RepID=UPI002895EEA8|nr:hypothetical protein [Pseudomonas oryzihabitans]MDT3722889.1 hypothetical protein [Pseudomonas oryzihabitans]
MTAIDVEGVTKGLAETTFSNQNLNSSFKSSHKYSTLLTPIQAPASSTSASKYVQLDAKARTFRSADLCFVREIQVFTENPKQSIFSISLKYLNTQGEVQEIKGDTRDKFIVFFIRDYLFSFELGYSKRGARPNVTNIAIYGVNLSTIENRKKTIAKFFDHALTLNTTIENAKLQATSIQEEIDTKNEEFENSIQEYEKTAKIIEEAKAQVAKESERKDSIAKELKSLQNQLESLKSEESQRSNNCTQLLTKETSLNQEIATKSQELSAIINDKNLISDEYKDYVKEGKNQSSIYIFIIILCLSTSIFSLWLLYNGAKDILVHPYSSSNDVFASFLLRIPFAAVISGALYGSLKMAHFTFSKMLAIHEERLTLAKLLIIAKETVYSTAASFGISDDEKFRSRIEVKLEMLKAYLANSIGSAKIKISNTTPEEDKELEPLPKSSTEVSDTTKDAEQPDKESLRKDPIV